MSYDSEYYRAETERCRELAAAVPGTEFARRWRELADQYAILAEEVDAAETGRVPILRMPLQLQQQQQRKI
jgi:hypothetical protein